MSPPLPDRGGGDSAPRRKSILRAGVHIAGEDGAAPDLNVGVQRHGEG